MCSKPAIFFHIPKTAGTTLHTIVDRQYAPEKIYSFGSNAQDSIKAFQELSIEERSNLQFLRGHMPFGLHDYFPQSDEYFTLLRDPVARVVSYYNFILRTPDHYLYEIIKSKNMSLFDLMQTDYPIMMNDAQVRLLSGIWADVGFGKVPAEMLEKAKSNLKNYFVVVGITEEFDKTLFLLKEKLRWPSQIFYKKENVTRKKKSQSMSAKTLEIVRRYNQLDQALYQFAKTLFLKEIEDQGPLFPFKVKIFQLQNKFYSRYLDFRSYSVRMVIKSNLGKLAR